MNESFRKRLALLKSTSEPAISKKTESGYVYLIIEREFRRLGEKTYKIGRTAQDSVNMRTVNYPKESKLLLALWTNDCVSAEGAIIKTFNDKYEHKGCYGAEYFSGNHVSMMRDMFEIVIGKFE